MHSHPQQTIRIAAALVTNGTGELLLVRKAATRCYMQAGGKIEAGENPWSALRRELLEEIGLELVDGDGAYLGCFSAEAANEAGCLVEAELFHICTSHKPVIAAEIAEAVWLHPAAARELPLAPLTRDHVLPLMECLTSPAQRAETQTSA